MPTKAPKKPRNMANPKEVLGAFSDELGGLRDETFRKLKNDVVVDSGKAFMDQPAGGVDAED